MFYDWLIRRRMPLTYMHWMMDYAISWMPPCAWKDFCETWLQRSVFFVKTANLKVVGNLGKCNNYSVMEIDNFLSADQCDLIIEQSKQKGVVDSTIIDDRGTRVLDLYTRKSKQTWLTDAESAEAHAISDRVSIITDLPRSHQEDLQVVAYPASGYYNPHFDASFHPDVIPNMNRGCGPRLYTFLIYLNDDFEGGETDFPEIGVKIVPKKGKAILFQNIDAQQDLIPESMHAGCPVRSGTKWIANKWVRIWPFELSTLASVNQPPICNRPVRYPTSWDMAKHNLLHYNSITIPENKVKYCEVMHLPQALKNTDIDDTIERELTCLFQSWVPIPMANKDLHFSQFSAAPNVKQFGQRLASMYVMVSDHGSVTFPYLNKTYDMKKGDVLMVYEVDEMLLYNAASQHTVTGQTLVKNAFSLPQTYTAMLDAPEQFGERVHKTKISI